GTGINCRTDPHRFRVRVSISFMAGSELSNPSTPNPAARAKLCRLPVLPGHKERAYGAPEEVWNSCVVVSSSGGGRSQRRGIRGGRRPPGLGVAGGFCRRRGAANACVSTWRNDYENSAGLDPRASRHKCPCVRNECRKVLWIWWEGRGVW